MAENVISKIVRLILDRKSAADTEAGARQSLGGIDKTLAGLRSTAAAVGKAILAAFAVRAVISFGREAVAAALESRKAWGLLANAVNNTGASFAMMEPRVKAMAKAFRDAGVAGDEDFADALRTLTSISGDAEKSLANMIVVADVAAARFDGDLAPAADLVAKAMVGNVTALQKLGIEIPPGADAVAFLAEQFRGTANAVDEGTRQQKAWNEQLDDLKESIGEAILGVSAGESSISKLSGVIETATRIVDNNRGAIANIGQTALWFAKQIIGNVLIRAYEGWAYSISLVADGMLLLDRATIGFGNTIGREASPEILAEVAALEKFSAAAAKAVVDAEALRKSIFQPPPPGTKSVLDLPSGPIGGSVKGAKGGDKPKTPEEAAAAERRAIDERISAAREAVEFDDLRAEGLVELIALEAELQEKLNDGNISFADRVAYTKDLRDVQDALIGGMKGLAEQAGISEEALNLMWDGNWRGAFASIGKEAKISALWNLAKAAEEFARGFGWLALGNFPSAAAAKVSAGGHLATAAKWGAVAALAGSGGGGGGSAAAGGGGGGGQPAATSPGDSVNGARTAASRTSSKVQPMQPVTEIHFVGPGFDAVNPAVQRVVYGAQQEAIERVGKNARVRVIRSNS